MITVDARSHAREIERSYRARRRNSKEYLQRKAENQRRYKERLDSAADGDTFDDIDTAKLDAMIARVETVEWQIERAQAARRLPLERRLAA